MMSFINELTDQIKFHTSPQERHWWASAILGLVLYLILHSGPDASRASLFWVIVWIWSVVYTLMVYVDYHEYGESERWRVVPADSEE